MGRKVDTSSDQILREEKQLASDAKEVVAMCNVVRKGYGLGRINKPRRGVPGHVSACSLAMSLEGTPIQTVNYDGKDHFTILALDEDGDEQWYAVTGIIYGVPCSTIVRFMRNFDAGLYPEYEIPKDGDF